MSAKKLMLPIRKDGSTARSFTQPPSNRSTTIQPSNLSSGRSQLSLLTPVPRRRLITLDGRALSSKGSREANSRFEEVLEEKKRLDQKLTTNTHAFKDVLIYCEKTIEKQDFQIERLDEGLKRCEESYEEKLRAERQRFEDEKTESQMTIDRLNTENLLMKTQLSNLEQLELELKEYQQKVDDMQQELAEKNEKLGKRELKERELIIITTEKVRKELEVEFAQEVEKIKKELQIQNRAQLEANQHVVKKVKIELKKMEVERDNVQSELRAILNELESKSTDYMMMEKEKRRLDGLIQKANDQADQRVNEVHEHLERIEAKLREDNDKNEKEIMRLSRELEDLSQRHENQSKHFNICKLNLKSETDTREVISKKLQDQNRKLIALRDFLQTAFETNNDEYIDLMLGENRAAFFAKLSTLLKTIPVLSEEPKPELILPKKFL